MHNTYGDNFHKRYINVMNCKTLEIQKISGLNVHCKYNEGFRQAINKAVSPMPRDAYALNFSSKCCTYNRV